MSPTRPDAFVNRERVLEGAQACEVLEVRLRDTAKARLVLHDGSSERVRWSAGDLIRSQERLYALAGAARRDG